MNFKDNKGSVIGITYIILAFMLTAVMYVFLVVFYQSVGSENVIEPLVNISVNTSITFGNSAQITSEIASYTGKFNDTNIFLDLYFFVFFLSMFILSIVMSFKAKKEGPLSFFGTLTFGMLGFLLILGFIDQITTYLIEVLIVGILEFDLTSTLLIAAYFNNIQVINLIWALIIIAVNQFELFGFKREGRVQA